MLLTRIVQLVLFTGIGFSTFLAIRVIRQDIRDHRNGRIPVDYDCTMRRTMEDRQC